jgi:hypothetical protein
VHGCFLLRRRRADTGSLLAETDQPDKAR